MSDGRSRPFLDRLDDAARKLLLSVARPASFAAGGRLVRQGEASRGAYVLREGAVEATVLLPGGETLAVARLQAGDVLGETALIERGTCTATVTARTAVEAFFIEREDFRALIAQREAAALSVQHAVTLILSEKLRVLNGKVLEASKSNESPPREPAGGLKRSGQPSFDISAFLPHLPIFEGFEPGDIREIIDAGSLLEVERGCVIFRRGEPSTACFIVLRGAVEILGYHAKRAHRMAVLGPGQLLGYMSALERAEHGADALVREDALLLEIPREAFEKLYFGTSPASTRLHRVIQKSLLASLGQTNRHLTRLISQARLRGADKEGDELEKAYGGQIIAAALGG